MDNNRFLEIIKHCFSATEGNSVYLPGESISLPILETPLIGIALVDDPIFETYRSPEIIGSNWRTPKEWMPDAKTAAAMFFPFTKEIRSRHRASKEPANEAWSFSYGAHFQFMHAFLSAVKTALEKENIKAVVPTEDPSFVMNPIPIKSGNEDDLHYDTSWSNRHVAFAAGLGTFGIHRHLITERGCCGALATVITDCELTPSTRKYSNVYEYCIKCGVCVKRCPANAITIENLRNIKKCGEHGQMVFQDYQGACGKCLVGIPCENRNPSIKR